MTVRPVASWPATWSSVSALLGPPPIRTSGGPEPSVPSRHHRRTNRRVASWSRMRWRLLLWAGRRLKQKRPPGWPRGRQAEAGRPSEAAVGPTRRRRPSRSLRSLPADRGIPAVQRPAGCWVPDRAGETVSHTRTRSARSVPATNTVVFSSASAPTLCSANAARRFSTACTAWRSKSPGATTHPSLSSGHAPAVNTSPRAVAL